MKNYAWLILTVLAIIPAFISLIRPGIHNIQDNMQYFRIYEMSKCFEDGQFPCRWVPDMGYGYGYPLYFFYPPGPYYKGVGLHYLGFEYIDCVKLLIVGGFLMSGVAMYLLASELFKNKFAGMMSALLYTYVPVRAVEIYVRGSLSEFLAMGFSPLIFWLSYRMIKNSGRYNFSGLALSIFGLIVCHNLMTAAFVPVFIMWILWLRMQNLDEGRQWQKMVTACVVGVGLSGFYVVPLLAEYGTVHLESMTGGYFDYRQHFVSWYQLFVSNFWGYGSSNNGLDDGISLSAGQIGMVLVIIASVISGYRLLNKKGGFLEKTVLYMSFINIFFLFLTHQKSAFIWENVGILKMFQFPWRFLSISAFLTAISAGYLWCRMSKVQAWMFTLIIMAMMVLIYGKQYRPQKWLNVNDDYLLSEKEFERQQTASIFDYLPKSAYLPPNVKAGSEPEIVEGKGKFVEYEKGSDFQRGLAEIYSSTAIIRVPMYSFPGMEVKIDGKKIDYVDNICSGEDYCFGLISFEVNQGTHLIEVNLKDTVPVVAGEIISLATMAGMLIVRRKYEN